MGAARLRPDILVCFLESAHTTSDVAVKTLVMPSIIKKTQPYIDLV